MARIGSLHNDDVVLDNSVQAVTFSGTMSLTAPTVAQHMVVTFTATGNHTLNLSGTPAAGAMLICIVTNDGTLPRVTTFGTGFTGVGVVTGVLSKKSTVLFISDGTGFVEVARSVGI